MKLKSYKLFLESEVNIKVPRYLLNELFDTQVDPLLVWTKSVHNETKYVYSFSSRKVSKDYFVTVTKHKEYLNKLRNVLEIDFNLASTSFNIYMTDLNEVGLILSGIKSILDKHLSNSDWLVIESNKPRIRFYKRIIENLPKLELREETPNSLLYAIKN